MFTSTNWPLVLRHLIPAVYVPFAALLAFGIIVAVTGIGSSEHIEQIGCLIGGSSYVLVFAPGQP